MTQKDLARMAGINFRSLQDYEQGHKKLSSAGGDILLRLSTVLGCSETELLLEEIHGSEFLSGNTVSAEEIRSRHFQCQKYETCGRWICDGRQIAILFFFDGQQYLLPFRAVFTPEYLPVLEDAAVLLMEAKIESVIAERNGFEEW